MQGRASWRRRNKYSEAPKPPTRSIVCYGGAISIYILHSLAKTYRGNESNFSQRFYLLVDKLANVPHNGIENGRNLITMSH
jgi:hypothetical protein